uniref:Tyrosinase copper-binding domain-containing protein n=1 Tax=Meloidogyne floridensis TaxID=298350 RepID=A0A915PAR4_9BILA
MITATNLIFQLILFCCLSSLFLICDDLFLKDLEEFNFCQNLPHSNYLSTEDLRNACNRRNQWLRDKNNDEGNSNNKLSKHPTASQKVYFEWLESTRKNLKKKIILPEFGTENFVKRSKRRDQLLPSFTLKEEEESERYLREDQRKYRRGKKFIRKEYRMMTDLERKQLQLALNGLKSKHIDNVSIWDLHTLVHYPNSAVAAHWGPAFLPWHREFLRQFEITLQNEQPELIGIPFWDSTLDHGLPDPSDSILWSEELMGNGNGFVKNGPFKDWNTNVLMPLSPVPIQRLYRSTGGRSSDRLMSPKDVEWITTRKNFSQLTFCHDKTFESMHGLSHVWVGGFMFVIRVSPNDPTFYFHHAFIDYLWEQFRLQNQDRYQRENDYAIVRDGLSNDYTDFWFEYESVRHCSKELPFCDSKFLFCDKSSWRCRSKIVLGGNCTGFVGTEICYQSICIQNICRLPATEGNGFLRRERRYDNVVWAKTLMLTEGSFGLSSGIAHVTVKEEFIGGREMTAFIEREPTVYPETRVCTPQLVLRSTLNSHVLTTSNISFTHQLSARKFLDMDLSVHPKLWKVHSPFIVFNCQTKLINSAMVKEITERISPPIEHLIATPHVWFRVGLIIKSGSSSQLIDYDELEVEAEEIGGGHFEIYSTSLRRARSVFDQGILFLRASNPFLQKGREVTVKVGIRKGGGGQRIKCDALCDRSQVNFLTSKTTTNYCDSTVRLNAEPQLSEDVFATDLSYMPYLGHPSEWRFQTPFLSLSC